MMDGITVLAENTYTVLGKLQLIFTVIAIFLSILAVYIIKDSYDWESAILPIIFLTISVILHIFNVYSYKNVCYGCYKETTYKVTVSNKVNFKQFNNKYKILEQDGQIYEIIEREQ